MKKVILVTGSSGLVGSAVCSYFASRLEYKVHGVDNNQRKRFFGVDGDTNPTKRELIRTLPEFTHHSLDIRNRHAVMKLVAKIKPTAIIHAAAQPSHDLAAKIPFDDFNTNAVGTLNLLEAARRYCPESPFVFMSTNKVYGDAPNAIPMVEKRTRWDYLDGQFNHGIPETFSVDQCKHSLFGASKLAADILVQEYGYYFGMPTCCLRCGCLTGENHAGVQLHGFLSYLVKCNVHQRQYTVFGYGGKQVRDNLHAFDVARFIAEFVNSPRIGEVYNLGGGRGNSCSILEAFELTEASSGKKRISVYCANARAGDHICYFSDLRKVRGHYPKWNVSVSLADIIKTLVIKNESK